MYFSKNELQIIANVVADKTGVKFQESGNIWKVNMGSQTIFYPEGTVLTEVEIGYIIHEAAHLRFSFTGDKFFNELKKMFKPFNKNFEQLYDLFQMVEDIRVDEMICSKYPGAKEFLDANNNMDFENRLNIIQELKEIDSEGYKKYIKNKTSQYNMYMLAYSFVGWYWADLLKDDMCQEAIEVIDKSIEFIPEIEETKNAKTVFNVLNKLLPIYIPLCDDVDKNKKPQNKKEMEKMMERFIKWLLKELIEAEKERKKGVVTDGKKTSDDKGSGKIVRILSGTMNSNGQRVDEKNLEEIFNFKIEGDFNTEKLKEEVDRNLPKVRRAISVLKDLDLQRSEGNYQSGKLENRKLYKLEVGKTNIFSKKIADLNTDKNMAIVLLVDESGSMLDSGRKNNEYDKARYACISASLIGRALEMSHRPFAVYGFNKVVTLHKNWNERIDLSKMVEIVENAAGENGGDTNNAYAVRRAAKELEKRPERNKVMIVLSDGSPNPPCGTSEEGISYSDYDLKEEVEKAEKFAKVYGIGINSPRVDWYYKRNKNIEDISQLAVELTKIFNENVGKRIRR